MLEFLTVVWSRFDGWKWVSKVQEKRVSLPVAGSSTMYWEQIYGFMC